MSQRITEPGITQMKEIVSSGQNTLELTVSVGVTIYDGACVGMLFKLVSLGFLYIIILNNRKTAG